jgi:hypothetical protein
VPTGLAGTPDITVGTLTATSINTVNITSSIVTASVVHSSGSNIFGDASTDTHKFNGHITASGNISASGNVYAVDYFDNGTNISSIYSPVAGHSSIVTIGTVTSGDVSAILPNNTVSSSVQIKTEISGAFTDVSSSLASRTTTLEGNGVFTATGISGSWQSQDFANLSAAGISSSFQLSGSYLLDTTDTLTGDLTVTNHITASGNISASGVLSIPGFTNVSASLATVVAGGDDLGDHTATHIKILSGCVVS